MSEIKQYVKIGSRRILLTESMQGKTPDEIRNMLLTTHPEIKHAEVRTKTEDDASVIEFIARAGKKG